MCCHAPVECASPAHALFITLSRARLDETLPVYLASIPVLSPVVVSLTKMGATSRGSLVNKQKHALSIWFSRLLAESIQIYFYRRFSQRVERALISMGSPSSPIHLTSGQTLGKRVFSCSFRSIDRMCFAYVRQMEGGSHFSPPAHFSSGSAVIRGKNRLGDPYCIVWWEVVAIDLAPT